MQQVALHPEAPTPIHGLRSYASFLTRVPADALNGVAVFTAALAAYLMTAPRSIANSDSAELTTAAATLGIPHPPGYPLYVLIGRAFAALPVGEVAFRLNLMSAVFGAITVLLVFAIVLELTHHRLSASIAALSLAFSYHFWGQSLIAEVYTLDAALTAGTLYALCSWHRTSRPATLYVAIFLLGLGLANRTTSALLIPPILAWAVASGTLRTQWVTWLKASTLLLPGLTLYLFLPVRFAMDPGYLWNVAYDLSGSRLYVDLTSIEGVRWYTTAEVFRPLTFAFGPSAALRELGRYAGWLWSEFAGIGIVIGLLGVASAWFRYRTFFWLTVGVFVLQAIFYINYGALDKDQMFLITYLVWTIWIGLGVRELIALVEAGFLRNFVVPAATVLAIALPVGLFASNFASLDFSGDEPLREKSALVFAAAEPEAMIIGTWGDIATLEYFQIVKSQRPDLTLVAQWSLTEESLDSLISANIGERAVYVLDEVPALEGRYQFNKIGPLYRLERYVPEGGTKWSAEALASCC